MSHNQQSLPRKRNYKPMIIMITIIVNGLVILLSGMPGYKDFDAFDVTILPLLNAIFNSFTFLFLVGALIAIMKRNVKVHQRFIYAALTTTALFFGDLCQLPLPVQLYELRRDRLPEGALLLYSDYPYCSGCGNRTACTDNCRKSLEYGKRAPQKNRPLDDAIMAVRQYYRGSGLRYDFPVLLKLKTNPGYAGQIFSLQK